ncbi:hypothetical protein EMCG_08408 [[Emmonsia] crescens]|uniref:Uncharacterized protein n=1 Tax=[Emmonsia] crescens TaxID=73230 RepID=A0A0G2I6B3_9EURO|nr:hypothetical protein EMCG_08408 [Emmonsia crescens UAMH 3008]
MRWRASQRRNHPYASWRRRRGSALHASMRMGSYCWVWMGMGMGILAWRVVAVAVAVAVEEELRAVRAVVAAKEMEKPRVPLALTHIYLR